MSIYVRGSNPIWSMVDLKGHQFDDTFYMFVLENTIPYMSTSVYHTVSGVEWTNPIQFLANGTLPVDIYWNPDKFYRLEFRQGPTQTDPLIYEVDNYSPGSGDIPIDAASLSTNNQITNPQFSIVSFKSPFSLTDTDPDPIEVAPGWFLNLTGTGTVGLEHVPLISTQSNPTNAPYALRITLTGTWTGQPYLSQRFNQNGMLWSTFNEPSYVSNSITARLEGVIQSVFGQLYNSIGTPIATVLNTTPITDSFNEYIDHGLMPETVNTDMPPDAWIEYRLFFTPTIDIYLSSIQLINSNSINDFQYIQDTIERQEDHTFHYYRDSLIRSQKESLLTGWDFGLNPWQSYPVTTTNLTTFGYTADQTILVQQQYVDSASGNHISTVRGTVGNKYGFTINSITDTNQFAMIQYIDSATMRPEWGKIFSSLVKLTAQLQNPALVVPVKMCLLIRTTLPPTLSRTEPIISWAIESKPIFATGWTELLPKNNPVYNILDGENTLLFEGFELPEATTTLMTLAVVLYTQGSMEASSPADYICFNKVSFVQNEFAIDTPSLTFDETLRRCQYYYETSFEPGGATLTTGPQRSSIVSALYEPQTSYYNPGPTPPANVSCFPNGFGAQYKVIKRANPTLSIYSGASTSLGEVLAFSNGSSGVGQAEAAVGTFYTAFGGNGVYGFSYRGTGLSTMVTTIPSTTSGSAGILFHYVANSRLGV